MRSRTPPAQRLLTLVAVLLDARRPLTFADIQGLMDGEYGVPPDPDREADEAARRAFDSVRRKFERDKALLAEAGIRIRWAGSDEDEPETRGYLLDPADMRMADVRLEPAELRVLLAAASLAGGIDDFPLREDLRLALAKVQAACAGIDTGRGDDPLAAGWHFHHGHAVRGPATAEALELLGDAVVNRTRVRMTYRTGRGEVTEREVRPYGLWLRHGVWSVVAWCGLREAVRVFDVHRVVSAEAASGPGAFDVPEDFDLAAWSSREPWELDVHPPIEVRLRLDRAVAGLADARFGTGRRTGTGPDGVVDLVVRATNLDPLIGLVLSLWGRARVLGPPEAAGRLAERVASLAAAHGGGAP